MNTEIIIHPKLQHCGLTTGNLTAMLEWYGKVLREPASLNLNQI